MRRVASILILMAAILLPGEGLAETVLQTVISNGRAVNEATDRVVVIRGKEKLEVLPGLVLEDGDELTTLAAAQVVLLREPGSVEIYVGENTEIRIASIFVRLGEIYVRVKKELKEAFEVKSDYGVAGVEGTEFILRVDDKPDAGTPFTCLTVEGMVRFTPLENAREPVFISAGEAITVDADRQSSKYALSEEAVNSSRAQYAPLIEIHRQQVRDVQVPYLIGSQQRDARSLLNNTRLSVGEIEYVVSGPQAEIGVVLGQDPEPGTALRPFGPVSLVVEAVPATVPNLIGRSEDEAQDILKDSNLQLGEREFVIENDIPEGTITRQSIEAGELVPEDSMIDIGVSGGGARPMPPILDPY